MTRWHKGAYLMLVLAFIAVVAVTLHNLTSRVGGAETSAAAADRNASAAQTETAANKRAAQLLASQVERLGGNPVVDPDTLTGAQGLTGAAGPSGIAGLTGPTGDRGPAGRDGQSITGPIGPRGSNGPSGLNGADGVGSQGAAGEPGPAGPPGERGPAGADGADGTSGADGARGEAGVGIASLACDSVTPLTLTITYTDGTTATVTCGGPPS